ncbi:Uncharacterised protein [Mycobacteroides abscessus subsp. abscessus]|nr:Uncharacterised protein [Mycobacteroides abscessus subsp. abscessus]
MASIAASVAVRTATVDAVADVQRVKIDAVAAAGERALLRAALLGQVQQQLVLACPASSGDMDVLNTITTIGKTTMAPSNRPAGEPTISGGMRQATTAITSTTTAARAGPLADARRPAEHNKMPTTNVEKTSREIATAISK